MKVNQMAKVRSVNTVAENSLIKVLEVICQELMLECQMTTKRRRRRESQEKKRENSFELLRKCTRLKLKILS